MPRKRKYSRVIDQEQRKKKKIEDERPNLPDELILENILTRLPARDLGRFTTVSKLWYDSIHDNARFTASHFAQQQNSEFNLVFNLFNVSINRQLRNCFFSLQKDRHDEFLNYKSFCPLIYNEPCEPLGYCNGLACLNLVRDQEPGVDDEGAVAIINPSRSETLTHLYAIPTSGKYLGHGFGFDSSSNEYKVVVIYTTTTSAAVESGSQGFLCMVITLGTKSWRKSVTSTSDMSPPPGCSPFPDQMVTRPWRNDRRSASLCGGNLVWTITNSSMNGYTIEMLLSFDIHSEKIQFIGLPTECTPLTPTMNDHQSIEVGHHLLEFKGYPCVARCEKILLSDTDHQHHRGRRCKQHRSSFCCYCFKVHLYTLKDKLKQIWVKEETFDVRIKAEGLINHPLCCYFNTTATTTTSPTRVMSVSDQVILYWFDGECLVFYNLQMKHLKVVKCSRLGNKRNHDIFTTKKKELSREFDDNGNIYFPCIDYQLNAHVENILSLKTFIPEGQVAEFDSHKEFLPATLDNYPIGWLTTGFKPSKYFSFLK